MERPTLHLTPPDGREPEPAERRRLAWREFRHAYPGVLVTAGVALVVMFAVDGWAAAKLRRYTAEIARLRAGMTGIERQRTDALVANSQNHLRLSIALLRRQAQGDQTLHLTVSVDSGVMYFAREGATLRVMPVETGPERTVGTPPDTVRMAVPRGTRTVERVLGPDDAWEVPGWVYTDRGVAPPEDRTLKGALGPSAIVLSGGAVIYALPSVGPLNDSAYVLPGSVRAAASDLKAVAPNVAPGMTVYIY